MSRAERLAEMRVESSNYLACHAMFNQAVADHLRLPPADAQFLRLMITLPGPFTTRQVAELTGLSGSAAGRLVDRLERTGYLTRRRDEADRRRVLLSLEPVARKRLTALWGDLREMFEAIFADHSEDELAVIIRYMRQSADLAAVQIETLRGRAAA